MGYLTAKKYLGCVTWERFLVAFSCFFTWPFPPFSNFESFGPWKLQRHLFVAVSTWIVTLLAKWSWGSVTLDRPVVWVPCSRSGVASIRTHIKLLMLLNVLLGNESKTIRPTRLLKPMRPVEPLEPMWPMEPMRPRPMELMRPMMESEAEGRWSRWGGRSRWGQWMRWGRWNWWSSWG